MLFYWKKEMNAESISDPLLFKDKKKAAANQWNQFSTLACLKGMLAL